VLFGSRSIQPLNPAVPDTFKFPHGPIAHQPVTIGILMCLTVFVVGGLVLLVIGLNYWMKSFSVRRPPVVHRVR
jgi:hypothetical protein